MCGVMGYVGASANAQFFFQGLKRLEYRGYDSAGIAMMLGIEEIHIERAEGKLANLEAKLGRLPQKTTVGIGHTRWATHGKPSESNAHPHRSGPIVLLHNGIIENFRDLKENLLHLGYKFHSETDTEVVAHLLHHEYTKVAHIPSLDERMKTAIKATIPQLRGAYAFAIMCQGLPETLFAVKHGSPLLLGKGVGENYLASGITALIDHTQDITFLEDGDIAILTPSNIHIHDIHGSLVDRLFKRIEWSAHLMEKAGYPHFMLKEIHEHPKAIAHTLSNRIIHGTTCVTKESYGLENIDLQKVDRLHIIACGTSYYAALLGKYYIEKLAKVPVEVDLASEYRYRPCMANDKTLIIAVSQSGETADTLQAIKYVKQSGAQTVAIVNMPGSSLSNICDAESMIHAGPEVGVASTKAFSAQIISLATLALILATEKKSLSEQEMSESIESLIKVPALVEKTLTLSKAIETLAKKYSSPKSMLFIGRGPQYPIALEGALKLKELSYIHAEAYAAGELKHGPIALIDENMPVVCLAPQDEFYEKTLSNIQEIRARGGKILSVGVEGDKMLQEISDDFIGIPMTSGLITPFLTMVPMHLLAYWIAAFKKTDIDQPRNLAKSVTVE